MFSVTNNVIAIWVCRGLVRGIPVRGAPGPILSQFEANLGELEAVLFILNWAWDQHEALVGGTHPRNFEDFLG